MIKYALKVVHASKIEIPLHVEVLKSGKGRKTYGFLEKEKRW